MRITITALLIFLSSIASAQLDVNASLTSRYIWRGIDFGNSPTLLPAMTYKSGSISIGIAGAYSFPDTANGYAENDFWLEYRIPLSTGVISLLCTDLYFPSLGRRFFNFDNGGEGAHTVELGIQYSGTESFPIIGRVYRDVYNDPDFSTYLEVEYPYNFQSVAVKPTMGFVLNKSAVYGTEKASFFLAGISVTKNVEISSTTSLLLSVSWIVNVYHEHSYVVMGISL